MTFAVLAGGSASPPLTDSRMCPLAASATTKATSPPSCAARIRSSALATAPAAIRKGRIGGTSDRAGALARAGNAAAEIIPPRSPRRVSPAIASPPVPHRRAKTAPGQGPRAPASQPRRHSPRARIAEEERSTMGTFTRHQAGGRVKGSSGARSAGRR